MRLLTKTSNSLLSPSLWLALMVIGGCAMPTAPAPVEHRDIAMPARPVVVTQSQTVPVAQPPQVVAPVPRPTMVAGVTETDATRNQSAAVATAPIRTGSVKARALGLEHESPSTTQAAPAAAAPGDAAPTISRQTMPTQATVPVPVTASQPVARTVPAAPSTKRVTPAASTSVPASKPAIEKRAAVTAAAPVKSTAPTTSAPAEKTAKAPAKPTRLASRAPFIWPASGSLVQSFTDAKSMGIGISGRAGDPIAAAADGKVIFSGLGPRGYGKLLIVKHNGDLLSVYAHNQSLLVKEGQAVRQGQQIAELGSTGTDRPKLHFEIRRQGKPVDPMAFLPRK